MGVTLRINIILRGQDFNSIRGEIVVALHLFTPLPSPYRRLDRARIGPDVASAVEVIPADCGSREPYRRP